MKQTRSHYNHDYYIKRMNNPEYKDYRRQKSLQSYYARKAKVFEENVMDIYKFIDERVNDNNFDSEKDTYMAELSKKYKIVRQKG